MLFELFIRPCAGRRASTWAVERVLDMGLDLVRQSIALWCALLGGT
jgi:hypothetical protein